MSGDIKRFRNSISSDLTEIASSISLDDQNTQSWDRLPLEMAIDIYRLLPNSDKHKMSLTCKSWLSAFKHPGTWRRSHFLFTGSTTSAKLEIPGEVLSSLQYVTIDCSVPRHSSSEEYLVQKTKSIVEFVSGLKKAKNSTLQELRVLDMKALGPHATRNRLNYHLNTLLCKQTKLSSLSVFNAGLRKAQGMKLLAAAAHKCAHHLKYINIRNLSRQSHPPGVELPALCGTCTHLTELSLDYGFMSDELLNHLSGTLKLIIVWVHNYDFSVRTLGRRCSDNCWSVLVSRCTDLKAEYHLENINSFVSVRCLSLPAIPMATLHWYTEAGAPNRLRLCFEHIINTFMNVLEHLHVDVGCTILSERDVVAVVECCPLLQTFSISRMSVPLTLISQLENILVHRQLNKRLQTGTSTATEIW